MNITRNLTAESESSGDPMKVTNNGPREVGGGMTRGAKRLDPVMTCQGREGCDAPRNEKSPPIGFLTVKVKKTGPQYD